MCFQWSIYFLADSEATDRYFYLITVHTGFRRGSGTKSNVCFVLSGEDNDTGVRLLTDGITEVFCILKNVIYCYVSHTGNEIPR